MAKAITMISVIFLCLILFSSIDGEDRWKEHIRKRIVRDLATGDSFWGNFFWRRTTTQRIPTIVSSTTKVITSITRKSTVSTAQGTAPVSPSLFTTFQNEALVQTNKYRAAHCAPNLILNSTVNSIAQEYANKLVIKGSLVHSNNGYGENLYYTSSSQPIDINSIKGTTPVDNWYSEVNKYNWTSPGFSSSTGHFTQLVWIATKQFGIGIACTNSKKDCYIVANYSPPGNNGNPNEYQINVKKGLSCT